MMKHTLIFEILLPSLKGLADFILLLNFVCSAFWLLLYKSLLTFCYVNGNVKRSHNIKVRRLQDSWYKRIARQLNISQDSPKQPSIYYLISVTNSLLIVPQVAFKYYVSMFYKILDPPALRQRYQRRLRPPSPVIW